MNNFSGIIIFLKNSFKNGVDDLLILLITTNIIIIFKRNGFLGLYTIQWVVYVSNKKGSNTW